MLQAKYSMRYKCHNCGWSGEIYFIKGNEAPNKKTCPNCDCFAAEKMIDPAPMMPMPRPAPRPTPDEPNPYIPWPGPFPKDPHDPRPPWIPYCCVDKED